MINPIRHILIEKFSIKDAMEEYLIGKLMNAKIQMNFHNPIRTMPLHETYKTFKSVSKINLHNNQDSQLEELEFKDKITKKTLAYYDVGFNLFTLTQELFKEQQNLNPLLCINKRDGELLSSYDKMMYYNREIMIKYFKLNKESKSFNGHILNSQKSLLSVIIS